MANFLGPCWTRINYHGASAPHTMTLPTKVWSPGVGVGTFATWGGTPKAADDMIEELVTEMLPFFNSDTVFDNWTVFTQLTPDDPIVPNVSGSFTGMVGTNVGGSWAAAVEMIIIARTDGFGLAKLTLLDACSENDFNPILTPTGDLATLFDEWKSDTNGWSGRDNTPPLNFLKATVNLNQQLRKEYRMD